MGQDEMVILLELDDSNQLPRDLFLHLNDIFRDADKGERSNFYTFYANGTTYFDARNHWTIFRCNDNRAGVLDGKLLTIPWLKRARRLPVHSHHVPVHAKYNCARESIFNWHPDTSMGSSMGENTAVALSIAIGCTASLLSIAACFSAWP